MSCWGVIGEATGKISSHLYPIRVRGWGETEVGERRPQKKNTSTMRAEKRGAQRCLKQESLPFRGGEKFQRIPQLKSTQSRGVEKGGEAIRGELSSTDSDEPFPLQEGVTLPEASGCRAKVVGAERKEGKGEKDVGAD